MPANLLYLPPKALTLDWPDVARRADVPLRDWLAVVNARYLAQPITVLKGPADDALFCGWTLRIENRYGPMIAQGLAGGPLCAQVDRRNRWDVWFAQAADYNPAGGNGVHGSTGTTFVDGNGATQLLTSDGLTLNNLSPNANYESDMFVFWGTTAGQEYFGMAQANTSSFYSFLHWLIVREVTHDQWLVLSSLRSGATMMTGREGGVGFRSLCRVTSDWLLTQAVTDAITRPVVVNSSTFNNYEEPILFEQALVLPAELAARNSLQPLTTAQVSGGPPDEFWMQVGGNLLVMIPPP